MSTLIAEKAAVQKELEDEVRGSRWLLCLHVVHHLLYDHFFG